MRPGVLSLSLFALTAAAAAQNQPTPAAPATNPAPAPTPAAQPSAAPDGFVVREGFKVEVAIPEVKGARFMEFGDKGALYISQMTGEITTYRDAGNGRYEPVGTFINETPMVHGLCYKDGWLWFTTSTSVCRAQDKDGDGVADQVFEIANSLPGGSGHWWRPILVAEDGFYTSVGDPGNINDETNTDREKIWKFSLDGKSKALFCAGIRNTEKLRFRPGTTEIWGLDHGSDNFGQKAGDKGGRDQPVTDLNPPDEFNHYVQDGFYGHPFIVGNRVPRYEYLDRPDIHELAAKTTPPEWCVGAHWATNGFCFIDPAVNDKTKAFPAELSGDALIGCHGSWNSSKPVGYCIARIRFDKDPRLGGHPVGLEKIVSTIDATGKVRARPVDCVQAPDGSVLFSADQPGRVYRLTCTLPR